MSGLDRKTESINFNSMEFCSSSSKSPELVTIHNLSGNSNLNKKRKYKLVANDDLNATENLKVPTPEITIKNARSTSISVQIIEQKIPDNRMDLLKMVNFSIFFND